jgi:hypothetical protein
MRKKTIKEQVFALFRLYNKGLEYNDQTAQFAYNGNRVHLDPTNSVQLIHLQTGHKITTIDRYRREFQQLYKAS